MKYDDWKGNETLLGQYNENGHTIHLYKADNGFYRARIDHGPITTDNDMAYSASTESFALFLARGFCKGV